MGPIILKPKREPNCPLNIWCNWWWQGTHSQVFHKAAYQQGSSFSDTQKHVENKEKFWHPWPGPKHGDDSFWRWVWLGPHSDAWTMVLRQVLTGPIQTKEKWVNKARSFRQRKFLGTDPRSSNSAYEQDKCKGYRKLSWASWTSWRKSYRWLLKTLSPSTNQYWHQPTTLSGEDGRHWRVVPFVGIIPVQTNAHLLLLVWTPEPWRKGLQTLDM